MIGKIRLRRFCGLPLVSGRQRRDFADLPAEGAAFQQESKRSGNVM
jgi:hypothetical protein